MSPKQPSAFSIAISDTAAVGHINTGLNLYHALEALSKEKRMPSEQLDFSRTIELGIPAITNLALGLELLLKVHHFQLTGNYPQGHDIKKLGSSFPENTMNQLRQNYKELHDNPDVPKGVEFRFSGGPEGHENQEWVSVDTSTYDLAIAYIGPMYVKWRYIYEEFQEEIDVSVSFAPLYFAAMSIHKAIRMQKGKTKVTLQDRAPDA